MSTPPGLVGAALLFWGWQTGLLVYVAGVAVVLEASRIIPWRWDLSIEDESRIADLSTLVLLALAISLTLTAGVARAGMLVFESLPLTLGLLMAAQVYGRAGKITVSALLWARRAKREHGWPGIAVDLSYVYIAVCILSTSVANVRTDSFYAGVCLLTAWALWPTRSARVRPVVWLASFAVVAALGYAGQFGLTRLQAAVERLTTEWLVDTPALDADASQTQTAIGRIGSLKLANRVVLRVTPADGARPPALLREASYDIYTAETWLAFTDFAPVSPSGGAGWSLGDGAAGDTRVSVAGSLTRGRGLLALPNGAVRVGGLAVGQLARSRLGAVRVEGAPGMLAYEVRSGERSVRDGPPTEADLRLPREEAPVLTRLAADLALGHRPVEEGLDQVSAFFKRRFRYSTYTAGRERGSTPLGDFLERSRSGHCEYFATATVLLLRAAGIPARYATGYAVQEWSPREGAYVVRARHAHAWTLVWVNGGWRELDTTPSVWARAEAQEAAPWEAVTDFLSWVAFHLTRWWWSNTASELVGHAWWLVIPLAAWIGWRHFFRALPRRPARARSAPPIVARRPGLDSEFYAVERSLAEAGWGRHPSESITDWIARLEPSCPDAADAWPLAQLHCRLRFDPAGLGPDEREALRAGVEAWRRRQLTAAPSSADASSSRSGAG